MMRLCAAIQSEQHAKFFWQCLSCYLVQVSRVHLADVEDGKIEPPECCS